MSKQCSITIIQSAGDMAKDGEEQFVEKSSTTMNKSTVPDREALLLYQIF